MQPHKRKTKNRLQLTQEYARKLSEARNQLHRCRFPPIDPPRKPLNLPSYFQLQQKQRKMKDKQKVVDLGPEGLHQLLGHVMKMVLLNEPRYICFYIWLLLEEMLDQRTEQETHINYIKWLENWNKKQKFCAKLKSFYDPEHSPYKASSSSSSSASLIEAPPDALVDALVDDLVEPQDEQLPLDELEQCILCQQNDIAAPIGLDCKKILQDSEIVHELCHTLPLQPDLPLDLSLFTTMYRKNALRKKITSVNGDETASNLPLPTCNDDEIETIEDDKNTRFSKPQPTIQSQEDEVKYKEMEILCPDVEHKQDICQLIEEVVQIVDLGGTQVQHNYMLMEGSRKNQNK